MSVMMRLSTGVGLSLMLAALSGCGNSGSKGEDDVAKPVAAVSTALATIGTVGQQAPIYGLAEPENGGEAAITVPSEAHVSRIFASNGARVATGQVIATLVASPASVLDLSKARVDAANATAALARAQRLRADGLVSDAELESAQSAARTAVLTRDSLGARAAHLTLRAPVAGNVEALSAHEGDLIAMGTTFARVVSGGRLRVRFGIDPTLARRVRAGMPINITLPSGGASLTTSVQSVDPVVDPATRQAAVIALLPPGSAVSPGEIIRASIELDATSAGVTVPYAALLDDGGESFVFVIDNGLAHRRAVTVGQVQGNVAAITAGLKAGERVATSGGTALDEGMKVRDTGARGTK